MNSHVFKLAITNVKKDSNFRWNYIKSIQMQTLHKCRFRFNTQLGFKRLKKGEMNPKPPNYMKEELTCIGPN